MNFLYRSLAWKLGQIGAHRIWNVEVLDASRLQLLCTLAQEPTWHGQLQRSGHFDNCLEIANTLRSINTEFRDSAGAMAVHVTHLFAIIDDLGQEHPFLEAVQVYPSWPLILTAWRHIFRFGFFEMGTKDNWKHIAGTGYLEALPSLVVYATRYWQRWNETEETHTLIRLVEQVCNKLDEEMHGRSQAVSPSNHEQDTSFGHRGIPGLYKQKRKLLPISEADM